MKNKIKIIILFLIILSLVFPLKESKAGVIGNIVDWVKEKVEAIGNFFSGVKDCAQNIFSCALSAFTYAVTQAVHWVLTWFNTQILAPIVGKVAILNPFHNENPESPVVVIWNILKSFAYILLVFSALAAGYEWLLGDDASAKRLIFNIIVVALIISFTFVLVRETFFIVRRVEEGITNKQLDKLGDLIAVSLWQKDPFKTIDEITKNIETETGSRYLIQAVFYVFIVVFDMITFIILLMVLFLLIARYIMMIFLAGTSSVAAASLTFPEFRGIKALEEMMSQFRFATTWFEHFVRWLLVVPIFVILVILGNILKENTLAQIGTPDFIEFVVLLFLLGSWYIISLIIANRISKGTAVLAKGLATAALLTVGGIAAKGLMTVAQGKVGGILKRAGESIEEKVGIGGPLGWRSWVGQKIGKPVKEAGEKMIERRYGLEAEAVKGKIGRIEEQLRRTTDPGQIQNLTSQIAQLVQQYKGNNYVLKSINESIKKMSPYSASKILASAENLKAFASYDVPQETREAVIGLVDKLRKGDLRKMAGDAVWLGALKEISPDVAEAFIDRFGKEFKETDALEIITKGEIRSFLSKLEKDDNLRKTLNNVSKGFINALLERNIEQISNAMSSWDESILLQPGNTEKIYRLFKPVFTNEEIKQIILEAIKKSENREAFVIAASRENIGGFLRKTLVNLTDQEIKNLENLLKEEYRDTLDTIILEELEHQKRQEPQQLKLPYEEGVQGEGGPQQLSLGL
jgi:hypothetical protein